MKATGEIYTLGRGETELRIDAEVGRLLRLDEGSVLYVVPLAHGDDTIFVGAPYPTSSWEHLFRASFILKRETGRLHGLLRRLSELLIFCRSVELTSSLPLDACKLISHQLPWERELVPRIADSAMVPATVMLVCEVPSLARVKEYLGGCDADIADLHASISSMLGGGPSEPKKLQGQLGDCAQVEWMSPMRTVGEISRRWKDPRHARLTAQLDHYRLNNPDPAIERRDALKALEQRIAEDMAEPGLERMREAVRRDRSGLYISAETWRGDIWKSDRAAFKDTGHTARVKTDDNLVMVHADSDERVIVWTVRSLASRCIVAFTITFPAGGMESAWLEWITSVIRDERHGRGIILSAELSARREPDDDRLQMWGGRWADMRMLVQFDGVDNPDRAAAILRCFVALQAKLADSDSQLQAFLERHRHIKELLLAGGVRPLVGGQAELRFPADEATDAPLATVPAAARGAASERWRAGTIVSQVALWHQDCLDKLYQIEWWDWTNPFSFTEAYTYRPGDSKFDPGNEGAAATDAWGVSKLKDGRGGLSRSRLVSRIVEELLGPGRRHAAIVGARRSGKTSALRYVADQLWKVSREDSTNGDQAPPELKLKPLLINASVLPPSRLCSAIAQAYFAARDPNKPRTDALEVSPVQAAARKISTDLEKSFLEVERLVQQLTPQDRKETGFAGFRGERDEFMRQSRDQLCRLVTLAKGEHQRLVVLVDELPTQGPWMEPWVQAFWRELVESKELQDVSWVVSTSLTLRSATPYTLISSSFYEYNLEPLDEYEADRLISRLYKFSETAEPQRTAATAGPPAPTAASATPVLTLHARRLLLRASARMPYLLQVCCYCLFERAKRMRIPLLSSQVAAEVLDKDVLPQLNDYLEDEWGCLPEEIRRYIQDALAPWPDDPWEVLTETPVARASQFAEAPPPVQKALLRSGLIGAHQFGLVAPLVAFWIRRSGRHVHA